MSFTLDDAMKEVTPQRKRQMAFKSEVLFGSLNPLNAVDQLVTYICWLEERIEALEDGKRAILQ